MVLQKHIPVWFLIVWTGCVLGIGVGLGNWLQLVEQGQSVPSESTLGVFTEQRISSSQNILGLVNEVRAKHNLEPYASNDKLNASALEKACDMVERDYFGHVDPNGREAWHLFEAQGYLFAYAGENLIEGFNTGQEAMDALMASPKHRANILSEQYADIGIGRCGPYVVQHFGRVKYN